ncbi:hypothetical protein ABXN37_26450 [Piscinibacter sakaiensis]|uniref:Uncharacterized protein n=1 Tax=Piscinibacter sakaiensis TaxID=1547922 RepID=A0A0K8P7N5_PISS1|nr:hypothetical protein [Piscinibacter sakaiensis]GAP38647.1 hypothetical protein ISF6_5200 [Piscinibacter sakaiensis]
MSTERDGELIESTRIVSRPGAVLVVHELNLTPRGRDMLRVDTTVITHDPPSHRAARPVAREADRRSDPAGDAPTA